MTTEILKTKLSLSALKDKQNPDKYFEELARILMCEFVIQKGKKQYHLTDIEFYLFRNDHRDIITYPRNCPAGVWFFHASGVDIAFESHVDVQVGAKKPYLTCDACFGGVLIRGIEKLVPGRSPIAIDGPMKSCDELFDQFDAFGNVHNFPQLVPCDPMDVKLKNPAEKRYGLNTDVVTKVDNILKYNYAGFDIDRKVLYEEYRHFLTEPYRFRLER